MLELPLSGRRFSPSVPVPVPSSPPRLSLMKLRQRWQVTEALGDALDELSDSLPLTSSAELNEFLVDYGFIEG